MITREEFIKKNEEMGWKNNFVEMLKTVHYKFLVE
jgi:hypothetical protein